MQWLGIFLSSVENASNEVRQIIAVVGSLGSYDCWGLFLLVKETWNGKTCQLLLLGRSSLQHLLLSSHFFIELLIKE